jgi:hypothetical protein
VRDEEMHAWSSVAFDQAQCLLQLEGKAHFSEASCRRLKRVVRRARPAAFPLALAQRNVRPGEVGLVAVGREEFETPGELLGRLREGVLPGKEEAVDAVSHPARGKPRQSFERAGPFEELLVTLDVLERRVVQPEPRLGLSRPEQRPGSEEIPRLLGDCERDLEVAERLSELPEQEMPLAKEIAADRLVDVAPCPLGRLQAGTE